MNNYYIAIGIIAGIIATFVIPAIACASPNGIELKEKEESK